MIGSWNICFAENCVFFVSLGWHRRQLFNGAQTWLYLDITSVICFWPHKIQIHSVYSNVFSSKYKLSIFSYQHNPMVKSCKTAPDIWDICSQHILNKSIHKSSELSTCFPNSASSLIRNLIRPEIMFLTPLTPLPRRPVPLNPRFDGISPETRHSCPRK